MFGPASKYYGLNRVLLLLCGLWPYQRSRFTRRIQAAFFLSVALSFIALQLATFIDAEFTINLLTRVLSTVIPTMVVIIKHTTFFLNNEKMKRLMDLMRYHWTLIQSEQELAILEKYSGHVRQFTIISLHIFLSFLLFVTLGHMLPIIQDAVSPLNTSRPRRLYMLTMPVDQERYFFPIITYIFLALLLQCIIVLGVGSIIVAYILHASAMLKIVGYRIEDAVFEDFGVSSSPNAVCEKIISGVLVHQQAIEFSESIFSSFQASYFVMLASGVGSLALNMFQIFVALDARDINELITNVFFICTQFMYLYVGNYVGQFITDHFAEVFSTIYHSSWYAAPVRAQKLLLFMMQRTTKNFSVVFGGIFIVSLRGFSSIASMSISYFTVICSMLYSS